MQLELAIFKDLLPLGDVEPLVPAPTPADSPDADPTPSSGNFDIAQQSNFGISHGLCSPVAWERAKFANFSSDYRATAALREVVGEKLLKLMGTKSLVPKKGLEPPHPCGYMDLNHARLPIPPLRRVTNKTAKPAVLRKNYGSIVTGTLRSVKPAAVLMSSSGWGGLD